MAQQLGSNYYNSPYKFNGKELDEETGFYYYGARYYDSRISIWLSVDPLAEKYPFASPYNYCLQNPINFVDPDGRDIELPKGTSKKDVTTIIGTMQKLTNDKLSYRTQKDGSIKIFVASLGKGDKTAGTNLIRRLNSDDNTMTIQIAAPGSGNSETDVNSANAINGKGSDVNVYFDPTANPSIMTEDPKTGNVSGKKRPNEIGLAHEMIHGDRSMRGKAIDYSETGTQTYKDASGKTVTTTVVKEEAATVGLKYNTKGDINENQIRKEQKQNKRGAY